MRDIIWIDSVHSPAVYLASYAGRIDHAWGAQSDSRGDGCDLRRQCQAVARLVSAQLAFACRHFIWPLDETRLPAAKMRGR